MKSSSIKIDIDLSEVFTEFGINKKQVPALMKDVLQKVSQGVLLNWREEVHRGLHGTRNMYLRGLQEPEIGENQAVIALIGTVPNMLEQGASPFDMKEGFKKSLKVTRKKNGGWILRIPFRWATPGAIGENEVFSGKMPQAVFEIVKAKDSTTTQPTQGITSRGTGLKESELPKNLQGKRGVRPEIRTETQVYGKYVHKSNIFSGIIRQSKTYAQAQQGSYISFRTVSDNSDPLSWIHKGLEARKFAEKAVANTNVDAIVVDAVDVFLGSKK